MVQFRYKKGNPYSRPIENQMQEQLSHRFAFDGNWIVHIENIPTSALEQINVLHQLQFTLSKQALLNIYTFFVFH